MSESAFISADTTKIAEFERKSQEAAKEFAKIKEEFGKINSELLGAWKGAAANAYKYETDHILEKIQSVDDVLKAINEGAMKSIRETYSQADEELGEFNRNPGEGEGE